MNREEQLKADRIEAILAGQRTPVHVVVKNDVVFVPIPVGPRVLAEIKRVVDVMIISPKED